MVYLVSLGSSNLQLTMLYFDTPPIFVEFFIVFMSQTQIIQRASYSLFHLLNELDVIPKKQTNRVGTSMKNFFTNIVFALIAGIWSFS